MKKLLTATLAALLISAASYAEPVTGYARSGQAVTLDLKWTGHNYGTIQWQQSADNGKTWTDIASATNTSYSFRADGEKYIRAVIKGDPACPEIIMERHITPVSFTTNIVETLADRALMEISAADFKGAQITEVGCAFGMSELGRDYTLYPLHPSETDGDINGKSTFEFYCTGLQPNTKYNVRAYFRTADGSLIYGPGKLVTTLPGIRWSSEDWSVEKTQFGPRIEACGCTPTDVKIYAGLKGGTLTERNVNQNGSIFYTTVRSCNPGKEYEVRVTAKVDGEPVELTKTVRTMSDYSKVEVDQTVKPVSHVVEWDNKNLVQLSPVGMQVEYPRMCRIDDQKILLTYHGGPSDHWKNSYIRKSYDNGKTWTEPKMIFDASKTFFGTGYWRICNPEMTRLQNGWILLSVVGNASSEINHNCKVMLSISKDDGDTWSDPLIVGRGRTWEPQVVQLPNGEVELLVSSEAAWWGDTSAGWKNNSQQFQEIVSARSTDNGETWTTFRRASYLPGCRDGMPVSVVMQGNKGVLFVIESVGSGLAPSLVWRSLDGQWDTSDWNRVNSDKRWVASLINGGAGAPHMIQIPTGEFLIMAHTNQTGAVWQTSRPQVIMADNTGHNFKYSRIPLSTSVIPAGTGCYYNSFFLYDNDTVWLLFTKAKYNGQTREESAIMMMQGKIVEK